MKSCFLSLFFLVFVIIQAKGQATLENTNNSIMIRNSESLISNYFAMLGNVGNPNNNYDERILFIENITVVFFLNESVRVCNDLYTGGVKDYVVRDYLGTIMSTYPRSEGVNFKYSIKEIKGPYSGEGGVFAFYLVRLERHLCGLNALGIMQDGLMTLDIYLRFDQVGGKWTYNPKIYDIRKSEAGVEGRFAPWGGTKVVNKKHDAEYESLLNNAIIAAKEFRISDFEMNMKRFESAINKSNIRPESIERDYLSLYTEAIFLGVKELNLSEYEDKTFEFVKYESEIIASDRSFYRLGYLYSKGLGVQQNYQTARYWYERAAEKGNAQAMVNLGEYYQNGYGVEQSYQTAKNWYEKAAEKGHSFAINSLGWLYHNGMGVQQNYQMAKYWYEKAIEKENDWAMLNLGVLYSKGLGVQQNYQTARYWYERAAKNGNAQAMSNLGYLYYNGYGVKKSYDTAIYWREKACINSYKEACEY